MEGASALVVCDVLTGRPRPWRAPPLLTSINPAAAGDGALVQRGIDRAGSRERSDSNLGPAGGIAIIGLMTEADPTRPPP